MRKAGLLSVFGALALLATSFPLLVVTSMSAGAQTPGMERRAERRDTRQTSRNVKHECNASGQSSRAGCRQAKRHVKQAGRHD
jgi:hypothetical protein